MNLFIGSSSIGVFKLFKDPSYRVLKVKGGTAKGLNTNDNGIKLLETITSIKKPINSIVLHFGEVDINFSYFYKYCQNNDHKYIDYKEFCDNVYNSYIKFIEKLYKVVKCKYIIIKGLYPNPVSNVNKVLQLLNYGIINADENCLVKSTLNTKFQESMRKYYNNLLHQYCTRQNKLKHTKTYFFYYDLDKYIIHHHIINTKFIDVSELNLHLLWEPMVYYHISILNKYNGLSKDKLINIEKEQEKYLKYKIEKLKNKGILISTYKKKTMRKKNIITTKLTIKNKQI